MPYILNLYFKIFFFQFQDVNVNLFQLLLKYISSPHVRIHAFTGSLKRDSAELGLHSCENFLSTKAAMLLMGFVDSSTSGFTTTVD